MNMKLSRSIFLLSFGLLTFGLSAGLATHSMAQDELPAEKRLFRFSARLPECNSEWALGRIQWRFAATERQYWNSNLEITQFEKVKELGFRPNGLDFIPRRYCAAVGHFSDQKRRQINYAIVEDAGIISLTNDVQWCVDGLDRHMAKAPHCKMARP